MSQRGEKYARNIERRTESLEQRADKLEESRGKVTGKLIEYDCRLQKIEADTEQIRAMHNNEVDVRRWGELHATQENRRRRREIEQAMAKQGVIILLALVLAIAALIVAITEKNGEKAEAATAQHTSAATAMEGVGWYTEPEEIDQRAFPVLYREAENPAEAQRIGEAMEAQGYFSAAVPLPWEYQDYMRTYCRLYGCPYPLALAVADWETRGQFNMDAIGPAGEVGIMQLNPGPDGSYHAELEAATGLDPTTPEGNIAGGCYKLGKYMDLYEDPVKAAMAYNMGQAGAARAWEAGITSTAYTDAVLEAMERWECEVNAWAGE